MKKQQIKYAQFNYFCLELPEECVSNCHHQGQCDDDVAAWVSEIKFPNPDLIRKELKEYGAWNEEELKDDEQNKHRILWIAAGNIQDEEYEQRKKQSKRPSGRL